MGVIDRAAIEGMGVTVYDAASHSPCHWCPTERNTSFTCRTKARYTLRKSRPATTANACEEHVMSVARVVAGCPPQSATCDLRLGDQREVLADVTCDLLCVDAPYSKRTHAGHDGGIAKQNRVPDAKQRTRIDRRTGARMGVGDSERKPIDYKPWTTSDVHAFVQSWSSRTRGWMVSITDHVLAPDWEKAMDLAGRYVFAPLPFVETGSRVRLLGDGPSAWTCWVVVGRPRTEEFLRWGTLQGSYVASNERKPVIGGKPLGLIREIVRDYSRPGDLVCDPCAGGGTTLLAAKLEGRRAIGAELNPETHARAVERLSGVHPLSRAGQKALFDEVTDAGRD